MYFLMSFMVLLRHYRGYTQVVPFSKYRQCIITAPVVLTACLRVRYTKYAFMRSMYPLAYASGALLKHQLKGEVRQYIDHIAYFNRIDSHYCLKEHTILYVFRAPRYDSPVPLNWYKQYIFHTPRYNSLCIIKLI